MKKIIKTDKKKEKNKLCCPLLSVGRAKPVQCLEDKCTFWYAGLIITDCAIVCIAQALGSIGFVEWDKK